MSDLSAINTTAHTMNRAGDLSSTICIGRIIDIIFYLKKLMRTVIHDL